MSSVDGGYDSARTISCVSSKRKWNCLNSWNEFCTQWWKMLQDFLETNYKIMNFPNAMLERASFTQKPLAVFHCVLGNICIEVTSASVCDYFHFCIGLLCCSGYQEVSIEGLNWMQGTCEPWHWSVTCY